MYRITTGIHIHFAHHVRGHSGPCISVHGHTWKFDVTLEATELDKEGFVADFDVLHEKVLMPCHTLLDHSFAMGEETWSENEAALTMLGNGLVNSRMVIHGHLCEPQATIQGELNHAQNRMPGGMKVAVFPFTPTSERLAEWLFGLTQQVMADDRVKVASARIWESLHPSEAVAEYAP